MTRRRNAKAALPGGFDGNHWTSDSAADCTTLAPRRNRSRVCDTASGAEARGGGAGSLLLADGATPRDAWISWLSPVFAGNDSAYVTGTYSDEYGYANGLMLPRNVHKDVQRFIECTGFLDLDSRRYICGVEKHAYRDILHWHGIIEGPFNGDELRYLKLLWGVERGFARVLPVQDGCASYVTKYALKGDTDSFEWRLS